jgi:hypothetical protein
MPTKSELIRVYLQKHTDEGPKALAERIANENKGLKVSPNEVSNIKSLMKKERQASVPATVKAKSPGLAKPRAASNGQAAAPGRPAAAGPAEQVAKLKQVAAAIGKDEAKKILDLL